jgi:inhibitor of cysteine peptidase
MKTIKMYIGLIIIATALLAVCTGKSSDIVITGDQNNSTQTVQKGDVIAIQLSANPSTGYGWEVENLDSAIIEQVGEVEYQQEKSDQPIVGAPETAVIRLKAVGSGETAVKLIYHRSWETGVEPLETFYLNVVVK